MQLKVINSNSMGNAYILEASNGKALLIECGVNFMDIKKALAFNLTRVVGCILTHEHGDHAKSITDVMKAGINVFSSAGTLKALKVNDHHRARVVLTSVSFTIGDFTILPFKAMHDCAEPFGYLIRHAECGTVLFLTDSYYCEYTFPNLNNIIIEANYCKKIIDDRVASGANPKFLRDRVMQSHMSLSTCKMSLKSYDLSAVNNIVLIHLSDGNSDEARFKKEIQELTGKNVHVANAGLTIPFNKTSF